MPVKSVMMEVFSGEPPCSGCVALLALADEYAAKYGDKLQVVKLVGKEATAKFAEYRLGCTPALVINGKIRVEGVCPSRETLNNALAEGGLL